jgi:hypothetical protein
MYRAHETWEQPSAAHVNAEEMCVIFTFPKTGKGLDSHLHIPKIGVPVFRRVLGDFGDLFGTSMAWRM